MPECGFRAGEVAVVGAPNTGKSTLINALLGQKLVIASPVPGTTRTVVRAVLTRPGTQAVLLDTPGFFLRPPGRIARQANDCTLDAISQADAMLLLARGIRLQAHEEKLLAQAGGKPVILVLPKVDRLKNKRLLLPVMESASSMGFSAIVPISAQESIGLDGLAAEIRAILPPSPPLFDEDTLSDRSERFFAQEYIREALFSYLRDEIPHAVFVDIEEFSVLEDTADISAVIFVEKPSQRAIVLGEEGKLLHKAKKRARASLADLLQKKVSLSLWIKVRKGLPEKMMGEWL